MNNERQDGTMPNSNNQQASSSLNQQPPVMGPPSASLTAALFAERAPRRSALQTREGTGYIPRLRQRDGYDDVLASQNAFQNIGKRSGQIIVNTDSADPNAFFDANNNQNFINQQLHRDDQSSVLSLSNITMNDSDSAMSMISSKTAVTFLSSGDDKSPDENAVRIDKPMEYVTSSSEDDTSVKQIPTRPTLTIKQPKKAESPNLAPPTVSPVSPVLDTVSEIPPEITDTLEDKMAPPTPPSFHYEQGGLDDDKEFDSIFEEQNTFEPEPKKKKVSETRKTKQYIYEKSSSEEEEEQTDLNESAIYDREHRRSLKSRQQRKALSSFPASLPLSEPESESGSESDKTQPKQTLEDSGIGPTQLDKSNVDLGQDFYRDEEVKLSQKQTELIGERYITREELVENFEKADETDDEEANELIEKIDDDDEDFQAVSEDEDEQELVNTTVVSTQNDDIDNGTDPLGIQSINSIEPRLRKRVTKPCKFWENERPLPKEAGKLMKIKPVPIEPEPKKKAPVKPKKKKVDAHTDITGGMYRVMNEFGVEEEVKIFATPEMNDSSHFKFTKNDKKPGGYATSRADEENADLSIYSSLTAKGVGVGTIVIRPGGVKPSSNTSTQSEVLYVLKGQASVVVHNNPAVAMKTGCVIHIPPFNSYSMKNVGRGECRLLYVFADTKDRADESDMEEQEEQDHEVLTKEQFESGDEEPTNE